MPVAILELEAPALELAAAMGDDGDLVAARLARGCRSFAACTSGGVAAYGWVSSGPEWIGEIRAEIRPGPGEAYIWNCVTLPLHRRRGLFRALLGTVVERLREEGMARAWIASVEGGAQQAVVDAGFAAVLSVSAWSVGSARVIRVLPVTGASPTLVNAGRRALGMPRAAALGLASPRRH